MRDRVSRNRLLWVKLLRNIYWSWMTIGKSDCFMPSFAGEQPFEMVHVTDFELDSDMMELLGSFESRLESAKMQVSRISFGHFFWDLTFSFSFSSHVSQSNRLACRWPAFIFYVPFAHPLNSYFAR